MLITVNVLVFLVMFLSDWGFADSGFTADILGRFAMIPQNIIDGQNGYTLFTSMFLHAGLMHLLGNMLYLYVFGDNVEGVFGHFSYVLFYVVCGLAASFLYILSIGVADPKLYMVPVVGASGAISGVLGAYVVLYPKAKILTLVFYGIPIIVPIPAIIFLGIWFLMQWFFGIFDILVIGSSGGIAYWAHVGGFIAGLVLAAIIGLKRKRDKETHLHL